MSKSISVDFVDSKDACSMMMKIEAPEKTRI